MKTVIGKYKDYRITYTCPYCGRDDYGLADGTFYSFCPDHDEYEHDVYKYKSDVSDEDLTFKVILSPMELAAKRYR